MPKSVIDQAIRQDCRVLGWREALILAARGNPVWGNPEWFIKTCRDYMPRRPAKPGEFSERWSSLIAMPAQNDIRNVRRWP